MSQHLHDLPFEFYRVRGGTTTRIHPHAGARLHFGSREPDSLSLPDLPTGTLASGDQVKATYLGTTVFLGAVDKRIRRYAGGGEQTDSVTVLGPWAKMSRLVYLQDGIYAIGSGQAYTFGTDYSSRVVLNETKDGDPQTLNAALLEIANGAKSVCGFQASAASISVSTQTLPSDECRDVTVADAIRRELRLFPKAVARFDYSTTPPTLVINKGSPADYSVPPKTEREIEYDDNPITGVDLEIESTGEIEGVLCRTLTHQKAGTAAGNPGCLYATLQIKGAYADAVRQSFTSVTENVPQNLNSVDWWKQKHPRLANVAASAITISDARCDGSSAPPPLHPRISAATAGELEAAGLTCKVCKFTAKATIETAGDKEEEVFLTMHFLMTNAEGTEEEPKTYTWVCESSAESGETVPAGLAAAILAERSGSIRAERMTIRLGSAFPELGDTITDGGQTLPLQSIDVDCADLTAELEFGAPEHLSPEDMAALLSNFRNKRTTKSSTIRGSGEMADKAAGDVEMGGIPPLSSTEFQPGTKSRTTIKDSSGGGSIFLDSADVEDDATIEVHELTVVGGGEDGEDATFQILSDSDVVVGGGGANPDKDPEDEDDYNQDCNGWSDPDDGGVVNGEPSADNEVVNGWTSDEQNRGSGEGIDYDKNDWSGDNCNEVNDWGEAKPIKESKNKRTFH